MFFNFKKRNRPPDPPRFPPNDQIRLLEATLGIRATTISSDQFDVTVTGRVLDLNKLWSAANRGWPVTVTSAINQAATAEVVMSRADFCSLEEPGQRNYFLVSI